MTNHNPTITSSNASGSFSENANTTGSSALHSLSGTMNFKDSDNFDTHTTSASLKSATLSSGTVIPATSLAHISSAMSSTIVTDSNTAGKLKWSFSAADSDFDFLSKNQTLTLTYEIKLFDNHGGSTKKTVTVTITGTDDKPIIDFGTTALVSEQAGHTLSFSHDTADLAIHFVDPDLTNTGHTVSVTAVSTSGETSGLLASESTLKSFFDIDSVVKTSGSSNGTINATFSAPDLLFDYLGEGETLDIVYTLKINDNAGLTSTQTVTITILGTNDDPVYIAFPDTAHLEEGEDLSPTGQLTAHGDFLFADIDLSDTHTVSTTVTAARSGGGAVPLTEAELIAALSTAVDPDSTNHLLGQVDWSFALDNSDVSFLNSGETLTLTYTLTLADGAGGTDTQTVTITILGSNDPVVVTSGPQAAGLAEFADTTGSAVQNSTTPVPTGAIAFTDTDIGDIHTVAVAVDAAVWSAGGSVPAATQADLAAALLTTLNDSTGTGSGSVDWTFSIPDFDLDFLAAGETLTVDYSVAVSDGPTSASQTVTITIDGANDLPLFTSGPGAADLAELANTTGSSDPRTTPVATLSFTDVDLNDIHSVGIALTSAVWSTGGVLPGQTESDLLSALVTTLNDSTGSGTGSVDWSFSIPDFDLDFLAAGETLTVTYDIVVADAFTSTTQSVTITITGAEDELIVNSLSAGVSETAAIDDGSILAFGNVITDAGDTAGDLSTSLAVTDVNGDAGNVGSPITGSYGDLFIAADGTYFFVANANLDALAAGATGSEIYTFTVTDSLGRSEAATLTLNFTGSNEAPIIVAAVASGSVTEDRGPTVLVNGGFESGDLTGWSASSANVSVDPLSLGGAFDTYTVRLSPSPVVETLSQDVVTTPGETYTLTFYVSGDSDSTTNQFTATWDGVPVLTLTDNLLGGLTAYSFTVVGGAGPTTHLEFSYFDDGIAMYLDQVQVLPASGPPTEETDGAVSFTDADAGDTHTASFIAQGGGYFGTFTLDPISEVPGSGSVDWHFTVNNSDIQFLAEGEALTQTYTVIVTDNLGDVATQDVTVTILGTNDAPTAAVADTIITDADVGNGLAIPQWALARNDTDVDLADTLGVTNVGGASGGSVVQFGPVLFFDDGTLGGSFTYEATDGIASSAPGTATVVNNAAGSNLVGTGADEILISAIGNAPTLDGGGGDDILIGNAGAHTLTGGSGDDIFAFEVVPDALNTITDFDNTSDDDMVAISASAFGSGLAAGMDTSLVFESSGDDQFLGSLLHYDSTNNVLYFSSDGTTASAIVVAQFQPGVVLNANDLMIV